MSSTGDATGEWDAGASGAASTWDAGDSGAANAWDAGDSGEAATWKDDKDTANPDHDNEGQPAAKGFPAREGRPPGEGRPSGPMICRNCKNEGHMAKDCKENRLMDLSGIPDEQPEIAWTNVVEADGQNELDDFKLVSCFIPQPWRC